VLDRHVGWIGDFGFRGMVVDEAHFIKNKSSQRSQHVLQLSESIRSRVARPLLMALTGTPLINDIEDFRAIWQFLGWIDDTKPLAELMQALEETGLTPADAGFYPAARQCVVDRGIVRRRKVDVAADIPVRRIADLPVELDEKVARSIQEAEQGLARRMVAQYEGALARRRSGPVVEGIDHDLVRRIATRERKEATAAKTDENVFSMMRRIGQAKAGLAADYAAQLARSAGKVVFFAKHVDVMDAAEEAPSLRRPRGELLHPHTPGERPVTAETGRGQPLGCGWASPPLSRRRLDSRTGSAPKRSRRAASARPSPRGRYKFDPLFGLRRRRACWRIGIPEHRPPSAGGGPDGGRGGSGGRPARGPADAPGARGCGLLSRP
jgi:hypothetical protein